MRGTTSVAPDVGPRPSLVPPRPLQKSVLTLGPKSRLMLWLLVVFLEISSASLLALLAAVYFTHRTRRSLLWVIKVFVLFSDAYNFLDRFAFYIASGYTLLGSVFVYRAARLLFVSVRNRDLRFGISTSRLKTDDSRTASSFHKASRWISRRIRRLQFLFGVHGPYFEYRFLVDEVIELVFQTLAAHASSRSISNMALNQAYGAVILINSLSTVVFQWMFQSPEDEVKQRVARLLTDLVLDFVWGTLLPAWMYQPIVKTYYEQRDHGDSIDFTENSAREVERVFILSGWSFVLSVVPFCNSLLNLGEVRSLLREELDGKQIQRSQSRSKTLVTLETSVPRYRRQNKNHKCGLFIHGLHTLVACSGVVIFIASLTASTLFGLHPHNDSYGCLHRVYPWFAKKEACVGRAFNCSALGTNGSRTDVEAALRTFEPSTLSDFYISDCRSLDLSTPVLHLFRGLQSLVITNSTIVSWERDVAALSHETMPNLRTVKLKRVAFEAPVNSIALFTAPLTRSVEWVYIIDTNMSEALFRNDVVGENWRHLVFFDCVSCSLSAFPSVVVSSMGQLSMLSLMDNDIRVVPSEWPPPEVKILMLWLDGNPGLTELSDRVWLQASKSLQSVYAQDTSLVVVPAWLDGALTLKTEFVVYAFGSPLCNSSTQPPNFINCEHQIL